MPDVHLSRAELTVWRDDGAGDRTRIVTHLASCAACREVAADVERDRPVEQGPERFVAGDFVALGYRSGKQAAASRWGGRWLWLAIPAALVMLALVPMWLARLDDSTGTMRGTGAIELVRPVNATVGVDELTFEWRGVSAGDRVRLNVVSLDRPAEPLIEREISGSRYEPTPDERRRFPSGQSFHWYVEARGGAGGTSAAARFQVR